MDTICSEEDYQRAVADTRLFLEGRTEELAGQLRERMEEASGAERFEQAAQLRDAMRTVETLTDRHQKMASPDLGARDVFGLRMGPAGTVIQVFQVRGGRVVDRIECLERRAWRDVERGRSAGDGDLAVLRERQRAAGSAPAGRRGRARGARGVAGDRAGRRVRIVVPRRGEKKGLLELAARNASLAYDARFNAETLSNYQALETLRDVLALPALPRRIDCFDISTIQGSETVASMVVCEDGRMKKADYRKFRIKDERRRTNDDTTE